MDEIKQLLQQALGYSADAWPWWVYLVAGLVPLLIFLGFRELCCWFWKFNSIDDRLRNIEAHLGALIELQQERLDEGTKKAPKDFTLE